MKDAAMFNTTSAGVEQSKAAYAQVLASIPAIQKSIREAENAMSMLLAQAPQTIKRGFWKSSNYLKISQWAFLCNYSLTVRM